jgi:hypothetical protein
MWQPRRLTTLWAFTACYRNSFTFYLKGFWPWCRTHGISSSDWGWLFLRDPREQVSPTPSSEDGNRSTFGSVVFFRTPDDGQSSKTQKFRLLLLLLLLVVVVVVVVLVFEFRFGTSETLLCSMSDPHVKIVPLLDVHQLLVLFAMTLKYS